jgi:hypothetical protein
MRAFCLMIMAVASFGLVGSYANGITNNVYFFGVFVLIFGIIGILDYHFGFDNQDSEAGSGEEQDEK